ncbi:MAG: GNAT family acetyltransferase [Granulosicoccaceae bacterium]
MQIRTFTANDTDTVIQLWQDCGLTRPWNNPALDIERKLKVDSDLFLVGVQGSHLVATLMGGYDGHRGWVNYLAVSPNCQGAGLGRLIMENFEARLLQRGCPKINLQIRSGNQSVIDFYNAIGYSDDNAVSMGKRLIPDE